MQGEYRSFLNQKMSAEGIKKPVSILPKFDKTAFLRELCTMKQKPARPKSSVNLLLNAFTSAQQVIRQQQTKEEVKVAVRRPRTSMGRV